MTPSPSPSPTTESPLHDARETEEPMPTATDPQDTADAPATVPVLHRRHADPGTLGVAGLAAVPVRLGADPVGEVAALWAAGARHVTLPEPVDLSPGGDPERAARALVALREMAAWAMAVDWRLDFGGQAQGGASGGSAASGGPTAADPDTVAAFVNLLSHLAPPQAITGVAGAEVLLATWRSGHFFNSCVHRHAPGFVQVRDRRYGELSRITIDEPDYIEAIQTLQAPTPVSAVPAEIIADFEAEALVGRVGDLVWWLPCRVRRWAMPAFGL